MSYKCDICVCSFKTNQHYLRHMSSNKHQLRASNNCKMFECVGCNKKFSHSSTLSNHKTKCKTINTTNSLQEQMTKMREDFEKERDELRAQISILLENQSKVPDPQPIISYVNKPTRRKIKPLTRCNIAQMQNNKCNSCSNELTEYFQIDHIIALQYGGTDDEQNLQALCCECHAKKSIIENKRRDKIKKAIDAIINEENSESPSPIIQNSL
jgi:hypothetical protein